jgi:hypothetical protein
VLFRDILHRDVGVRKDLEEKVKVSMTGRQTFDVVMFATLKEKLTFKLSEMRC